MSEAELGSSHVLVPSANAGEPAVGPSNSAATNQRKAPAAKGKKSSRVERARQFMKKLTVEGKDCGHILLYTDTRVKQAHVNSKQARSLMVSCSSSAIAGVMLAQAHIHGANCVFLTLVHIVQVSMIGYGHDFQGHHQQRLARFLGQLASKDPLLRQLALTHLEAAPLAKLPPELGVDTTPAAVFSVLMLLKARRVLDCEHYEDLVHGYMASIEHEEEKVYAEHARTREGIVKYLRRKGAQEQARRQAMQPQSLAGSDDGQDGIAALADAAAASLREGAPAAASAPTAALTPVGNSAAAPAARRPPLPRPQPSRNSADAQGRVAVAAAQGRGGVQLPSCTGAQPDLQGSGGEHGHPEVGCEGIAVEPRATMVLIGVFASMRLHY
jgi:hypothetical protein